MKTTLLLTAALSISFSVMAQKSPVKVKANLPTVSMQTQKIDEVDLNVTPTQLNFVKPEARGTEDISIITLGTSFNTYGLYNGGRTAVWADPNINSVAFFHRMAATPGSGFIAVDYSVDGGDTWTVDQQIFNPNAGGTAAARYPQGVIYNPQGNTNSANAYMSGLWPTLDGSNVAASWGGYGAATVKMDGTGLSQIGWPSDPPIRHNVPDAMTINPVSGDIFVVEGSLIEGLATNYTDTLVITRGVFNAAQGTYEYEQDAFWAPMVHVADAGSIADTRIAFAPDGQIGYISILGDNEGDEFMTGLGYYPIIYKTTDGGLTWSEEPIVVPLGGPEGLDGIVYGLLTDEQIAEVFVEPLPARDEIGYTTAFTHDLAVDANGNPVISVVIGIHPGTAYSIGSSSRLFASYNIFSTDQGQTWHAQKLGDNLITFRGTWGAGDDAIDEDNRSQVTTTFDGTKMFFSWLDTDFEGLEDNTQPDIFCVGWDVASNMYTEVVNVTYFSDAWLAAFMGTASYYAFEPAAGSYEIPFVYQDMNPNDPTAPVTYKYIKDFIFTDADFTITDAQNIIAEAASVSQNFPNPFNGTSQVEVKLEKDSNVGLEVFNMVGQKVYELPVVAKSAGTHKLTIDAKNLNAGIYTYSVKINDSRVTRKMIVK